MYSNENNLYRVINNKVFMYYSFESFEEPVTIKCGHKFCRKCIERVASLENSKCPCCLTKINKRSIPKECNELLQESVKHFYNLIKAIKDDSGIDGNIHNMKLLKI